jgi:hypothetical protein
MKTLTKKTLTTLSIALVAAVMAGPALAGTNAALDRWAANALRDGGRYGSLDAWAYNATRPSPLEAISEHSVGQNPAVRIAVALPVATTHDARAFSFRDAGIGAATVVTMVLVLLSSLAVRRRRVALKTSTAS